MDFSLNDEQVALREAVRRYCEASFPLTRRGEPLADDAAASQWRGLAELGLLGLPFPAELGGSEQSAAEVMLTTHELGRTLGGVGFVPAVVLAGYCLANGENAALCERWLSALSAGQARLSVAVGEAECRGDLTRPGVTAERQGEQFCLQGRKPFVLECADPDLLIVAARTSGKDGDEAGLTLFALETALPGVHRYPYQSLDGRPAARLELKSVPVPMAAVVGAVGQGHDLLRQAVERAHAAWCSEATGAIEMLFELTLEHLKTRQQFGSPLARFQALQHKMADLLMDLELARSLVCAAAVAVDEASAGERARVVQAAKVFIGQAGRAASHCAIQLHGAMGMTDECRVGHYAKRLIVIDQMFGNHSHHLREFSRGVAAPQPQS